MAGRRLTVRHERFPLKEPAPFARSARTHAETVTVVIEADGQVGRGESVPCRRRGETIESVMALIRGQKGTIEDGASRLELDVALPFGAARNALDCALWDLEAKLAGLPVWELAGLNRPGPVVTSHTIAPGPPAIMAAAAAAAADRAILRLRLCGDGDLERLAAVREAAPRCRLVVDAEESWTQGRLEPYLAAMAAANVELVEQPLPVGQDAVLADILHPVPIAADESVQTSEDLEGLTRRYDVATVTLDKVGGLTEALRFAMKARDVGLGLAVAGGCGSSLGAAPAMLVAQRARFVDLDGLRQLAQDRSVPLRFEHSTLYPAARELWG
ncbi:L-alanine-DL-glutamate epimerase [Arboricoccus pini]|uniref:Dipeptide epimerase n=1 Tax=Arboricoccus pini TaxID=1963835 RepID=A0A212RDT4_9PROT|nr:dipeptide epimerase [Arboricoccus pini]SNB70407.1 L-alanine-DL-glutamate epimerase [Arboricoccus pini]